MAIQLSDSIFVGQQKPVEDKYYNGLSPYTSTTEVNTTLASAIRYRGLTVNINGTEYWYKDGTADNQLVAKSIGLTVTGNSGAATLSTAGILNIPTYTLAGLGGQPQLNGTGFVKATGTTISYDNSSYLTTTLTSGNIFVGNASNIATSTTLTLNASTGTFGLSNTGVLTIPDASATVRGFMSTGTQVFAGNKTFNSAATFTVNPTFGNILSGGTTYQRLLATGPTGVLSNLPNVIWDTTLSGLGINGAPNFSGLQVFGNTYIGNTLCLQQSPVDSTNYTTKMLTRRASDGTVMMQDIPGVTSSSYYGQYFSYVTQLGVWNDTPTAMFFETADLNNGITVNSNFGYFSTSRTGTTLTVSGTVDTNTSIIVGSTIVGGAGYETAVLTGSIAGDILTITALTSGALSIGSYITASGAIPDNVTITQVLSGSGGIGTYRINRILGTISSRTITGWNTTITAQLTGTSGGVGTYTTSTSGTVSSGGLTTITCPTRITFANTGRYNLQFSTQFQNTDNAEQDIYIWLYSSRFGQVVGSTGIVSIPKTGHTVAGWNFLLDVVAEDSYEIYWSTSDITKTSIQYYTSTTDHPSTASTIFTVTQVSGIIAGTGLSTFQGISPYSTGGNFGCSPDNNGAIITGTDFTISYGNTTGQTPGTVFFYIPTAGMIGATPSSTITRGLVSNTTQSFYGNKTFVNNVTITGTSLHTGVATFTAAPVFSSTTASTLLTVGATKALTSFASTGVLKVASGVPSVMNGTANGLTYWSDANTLGNLSGNGVLKLSTTGIPSVMTGSSGYLTYWTDANTLGSFPGSGVLNITNGAPAVMTGTANTLTYWTSSIAIGSLSTATYPSLTELSYVKGVTSAIQTQIDSKQATLTNPVTGTGINNEIAYFNATGSTIGSLSTATYPSLTELSYVKGVTSALQTQLNNKQSLATNLTSLSGLTYASTSFVKMTASGTFTLDTASYQGALTLTTTGTSGAATLVGNTLNIPQYQGGVTSVNAGAGIAVSSTTGSVTVYNKLSTGATGGQSVVGGTTAGNNLTLSSTVDTYKGRILFGTSAYDELNNRLGIGTTSPSYVLQVNGTIAFPSLSSSTQSYVVGYNTTTGQLSYQAAGGGGGGTPAGSNGYLQFNNSGSFGADSNLFWNNTSKILSIGTTSATVGGIPGDLLIQGNTEGNGTARIIVGGTGNYQDLIFVKTNASGDQMKNWEFGNRYDTFFGNNEGSFQIVGTAFDDTYRVPLIAQPNGDLILAGASANATNGNVGIGTTSPSEKLQVNGNSKYVLGASGYVRLFDQDGGNPTTIQASYGNTLISNNVIFNGSEWVYSTSNAGSMIQMEPSLGQIIFNTAAAGDEGDPVSFIETIRLVDGKVGIGTNNPQVPVDIGGASGAGPKLLIYGTGGTPSYLSGLGVDLGQAGSSMGFFTGANASFTVEQANSLESFPYPSGYTTRLTVAPGGNVGIGTTSPSATLDINSSANGNPIAQFFSGSGYPVQILTVDEPLQGGASAPKGSIGNSPTGLYENQDGDVHWRKMTRPYRSYVAQLSQSGTNAPIATILENDLGYEPTWSRTSAGQYLLSSIELGAEDNSKVVVFLTIGTPFQDPMEFGYGAHAYWNREENYAGISTAFNSGSTEGSGEADDLLSDGSGDDFFRASFELRIYD
jgi:hypothetical protein